MLMMPNSIEMDVALMAVMATRRASGPRESVLDAARALEVARATSTRRHHQRPDLRREVRSVADEFGIAEAFVLGTRHARRMDPRCVADARSRLAARARRSRADDFHRRLDRRPEGRESHASRVARERLHPRRRVARRVRPRDVPERRADVPHLGAGLRDLGADLRAEHARDGAALRARTRSCARSATTESRSLRAAPLLYIWACSRARSSTTAICRRCGIACRAARRARPSCTASGTRARSARCSRAGA